MIEWPDPFERWLLLWLVFQWMGASGQQNDSAILHPGRSAIFVVAAGIQHGFIAHSPAVENTKGAHPTGAEINFSWQKGDSSTWEICNCYPRQGVLIAYYDYDTKILGKSLLLAYFLEPSYRISKRTFFFIKGNVGLAYLTNPFGSIENPTNQSYSGPINGYLLFGIGFMVSSQ
jgi:hypothetical protein